MRCSLVILSLVVVVLAYCQGCETTPSISNSSGEGPISLRLSELGISLPSVGRPVGAYVPAVESGNLVFVSGQIPIREGKVVYTGKVGRDVELAQAQEAARLCAINALATVKTQLGSLEQISRIVRVEVFVNSAIGFTEQSQVANGASDLLRQIFGEAGEHTRIAVGVAELPLNAAVELAMVIERK